MATCVLRDQNYLPLPFLGELIIVGLKNNPKTPNSWSFRKYNGHVCAAQSKLSSASTPSLEDDI